MSIAPFLDVDALASVADGFEAVARRCPQAECVRIPKSPGRDYLPDGLSWSYAEVHAKMLALREVYRAAGYGHGHRVSLFLENRPSFIPHWLALNSLGVSLAPINNESTAYEIVELMRRSGSVLGVCLPHNDGIFARAVELADFPIRYVAEEWPACRPRRTPRREPTCRSRARASRACCSRPGRRGCRRARC